MQQYVANVNYGTTKAQNAAVFSSNLVVTAGLVGNNTAHKFRVIVVSTADATAILQVTIDGTHYFSLNSGQVLAQNAVYTFDIDGLINTDKINFQFSNASGATLGIFRVIDIMNEG